MNPQQLVNLKIWCIRFFLFIYSLSFLITVLEIAFNDTLLLLLFVKLVCISSKRVTKGLKLYLWYEYFYYVYIVLCIDEVGKVYGRWEWASREKSSSIPLSTHPFSFSQPNPLTTLVAETVNSYSSVLRTGIPTSKLIWTASSTLWVLLASVNLENKCVSGLSLQFYCEYCLRGSGLLRGFKLIW